ncbi:hypothetical protein Tco_1481382, partial [Tanacetum coccineum]
LKLVLFVLVSAVKHMLMLPVQVSAVEGDSINTLIKEFIIMTSPKFAEMHNVVAFLEKPKESDGFTEIIDFLKASSVSYACIEQFWATAIVQTVNGVRQIQALVDKKRVIVTESSISRDLHLDDAEGTDCFLTATIFEELACMGKDFSGRITPLFDTMMVQPKDKPSKKAQRQEAKVPQNAAEHEESVPTPSNDPQPSAMDAQAKEIAALKKRIQRLERRKMSRPTGLKRLRKVGMSRRVESSEDQESLGTPEDASKQGGLLKILMLIVLEDDVMHVEVKVDGKDEQSKKLDDSTAGEAVTTASIDDSTAGEAVTTASIDDSAVPTTSEEITLAQTLIQIKAAKPKVVTAGAATTTTTRPKDRGVVIQEPSEFRVPQETKPSSSKDKGK